jgi:hypothetical protein
MKKIFQIASISSVLLLAASCSAVAPGMVTDNAAEKKGEASATFFLGVIGPKNADLSIQKACKKAGITKVSTVDYKVESKFLSTKYTTIVTGN